MPRTISFRYMDSDMQLSLRLLAGSRGHLRSRSTRLSISICGCFGGSALTDDIAVPKDRTVDDMNARIPVTYVPTLNTIFLSFALAWAETLDVFDIFARVNVLDHARYPDWRPEYISAFENMANLATRATVEGRRRVKICTPVIHATKAETIHKGLSLGVDYSLTTKLLRSRGRWCRLRALRRVPLASSRFCGERNRRSGAIP